MAERIKAERTAGWKKPEGAVHVGRGRNRRWGNPFKVGTPGVPDEATAVAKFRAHLADSPEFVESVRRELAGRDLMCWCRLPAPGEPDVCHGAVLLRVAAGGEP